MAFTLTWTGPKGSEQISVPTASDALREYLGREDRVVRLTVKDDHGRKMSLDDLYELDSIAKEEGEASGD